MTGHACTPRDCSVCRRQAEQVQYDARAELLPRLTPYFPKPEEGTREAAAA